LRNDLSDSSGDLDYNMVVRVGEELWGCIINPAGGCGK
jgi:hypothetical protein